MPTIFFQSKSGNSSVRGLRPGLEPVAVEYSPGVLTVVKFADGSSSPTTCLRCVSAPCMTLDDTEVTSTSLPDFPADRNPAVCPAGAINRVSGGAPSINTDACMLCGVCASRCPVGAISMRPYAVVEDSARDSFPEVTDGWIAEVTIETFLKTPKVGVLLTETDSVVDELRVRLLRAWKRIGDRFPDHLARNLLIAAGAGVAMRRKGDVAVRMDAVLGPPWLTFGCAEVEFGDDAVLDAPRDILDDIAVSIGRHNIPITSLTALIVTDVLPNWRSEYWRIIQDIRNVLGVRVGTITVLALCLMIWHGKKLWFRHPHLFHVDADTNSYRAAVLEPLLGRRLRISQAARPSVEVVK